MEEILNAYKQFISTNQQPPEHKILVSLLVVLTFALSIFLLSGILYSIRKINLLKLKRYSIKTGATWIAGAVILDFILISTKIANYNIVSFLVIAMLWDNIYQKLFNQAKEKEIAHLDSLEE